MMIFSFPAIVLNIGADIEGMGAVAHMIVPDVPIFAFEIFFTALILFVVIQYPYQKLAGILKWLCLVLLLYIVIPFLVKVNWGNVLKHTVIPTIHLNKDFFGTLVAILGTTISPYLFFWQATMEVEDIANSRRKVMIDKHFMDKMAKDVYLGMFFSNLVMFFIILTAGVVLYNAGIRQIDTVDQAAKALSPLTGKVTYLFFAAGVIGTGLLAIPVLGGALSYIVAETFNWRQGLDKKFNQAPGFYLTLIVSLLAGLCLGFLYISPIQALFFTAFLYGLTSPVLIAMLLHICNSSKIMGSAGDGRGSNFRGGARLILVAVGGVSRMPDLRSKEDGPFGVIFRLRKLAGEGVWGELLDCFYCLSIWISLPFALWTGSSVPEKGLFWMAYSGLACLLEKVTEKW